MTEAVDILKFRRVFDVQRTNRLALKSSSAHDRRARLLQLRTAVVERIDIDEAVANLEGWMANEQIEPSPPS